MQISFLCKGDKPIPGLIGPDQGWHFIRRIESPGGNCAVYEVTDDWRPREAIEYVDRVFYTKLKNGEKAGVAWDNVPLGKFSDAEVAGFLGVTRSTVTNARRQRHVKSLKKSRSINWDEQPLGRIPDAEIAKNLGVSPGAVWKARKKRGIDLVEDRQCG